MRAIHGPHPSGGLRPCKSAVLPICHGVFAPNHRLRAQIVAGKRERECRLPASAGQGTGGSPAPRMGWAQRLKRVFGIDVEHCEQCGGPLKIIAGIEDPLLIGKILQHLQEKGEYVAALDVSRSPYALRKGPGAPPRTVLPQRQHS